jgi:hypothetical protein
MSDVTTTTTTTSTVNNPTENLRSLFEQIELNVRTSSKELEPREQLAISEEDRIVKCMECGCRNTLVKYLFLALKTNNLTVINALIELLSVNDFNYDVDGKKQMDEVKNGRIVSMFRYWNRFVKNNTLYTLVGFGNSVVMSILCYLSNELKVDKTVDCHNPRSHNYVLKHLLDQLIQFNIILNPDRQVTAASMVVTELIRRMILPKHASWISGFTHTPGDMDDINEFSLQRFGSKEVSKGFTVKPSKSLLLFLIQNYQPDLSYDTLTFLFDSTRTVDDMEKGEDYTALMYEAIRNCRFSDDTVVSLSDAGLRDQIDHLVMARATTITKLTTPDSPSVIHVYSPSQMTCSPRTLKIGYILGFIGVAAIGYFAVRHGYIRSPISFEMDDYPIVRNADGLTVTVRNVEVNHSLFTLPLLGWFSAIGTRQFFRRWFTRPVHVHLN